MREGCATTATIYPCHTRLILLTYNRVLSCREGDFGAVHCNIMIKSIFCNTFTEEGTNDSLYLDPTTVLALYRRVLALNSVEGRLLMF